MLKHLVAFCLSMSLFQPVWAVNNEVGSASLVDALEATGPYPLETYKISRSAASPYGYGGSTVYFPKNANQRFGVVTLTPGLTGVQSHYAPLASRIASHGFVVVAIDTVTVFDLAPQRASEMAAAMRHVIALTNAGQAPFARVTDVMRRAVMGHSLGGGGALINAMSDTSLKAAVVFAPWNQAKNFSQNKVPAMIVACQEDTIAINARHADLFFASMDASVPHAEVEIKGAGHLCSTAFVPSNHQVTVAKSALAWLKLYVDEDIRYLPLVKGGMNVGDYSRYEVGGL